MKLDLEKLLTDTGLVLLFISMTLFVIYALEWLYRANPLNLQYPAFYYAMPIVIEFIAAITVLLVIKFKSRYVIE